MVNDTLSHVFVMWSSSALLAHVSLLPISSVAFLVVAFSPHLCYSYYEYISNKCIELDRGCNIVDMQESMRGFIDMMTCFGLLIRRKTWLLAFCHAIGQHGEGDDD